MVRMKRTLIFCCSTTGRLESYGPSSFAIFGINWVLPYSVREAFLVGKTLL